MDAPHSQEQVIRALTPECAGSSPAVLATISIRHVCRLTQLDVSTATPHA